MNATPVPFDALLAGASGLIGREFARQWQGPGLLHLLVRRDAAPLHASHRVHVVDFAKLPRLPAAEAACCCLGTTIAVAGSEAAFRAVDVEAVLAFARASREAGVSRFAVVSALGAGPQAGTFYNRVKGEMEASLRGVGFERLVIARPSLLTGDRASLGQPARRGEALTIALTRPLARLVPKAWRPIEAATVARALSRALAQGAPGVVVLESAALQDFGADASSG